MYQFESRVKYLTRNVIKISCIKDSNAPSCSNDVGILGRYTAPQPPMVQATAQAARTITDRAWQDSRSEPANDCQVGEWFRATSERLYTVNLVLTPRAQKPFPLVNTLATKVTHFVTFDADTVTNCFRHRSLANDRV